MSGAAPGRDWDAATYDRISGPQVSWALEQLERLELQGDEVVLDAGCGSGRVTALLADRLPHGRVYGVDVSESMAAHAREALGERAVIVRQDLVDLTLPERVDVVFSNATFHWIPDHDRLFAALHRAMKPGARLLAQCGGKGNIESFRRIAEEIRCEEPFAAHFSAWSSPWNYQGAEATLERLHDAGFRRARTWLEPKRVQPDRSFVQTVCLLPYLRRLPDALATPFVDRVIEHAGEPLQLDYIRLNIDARAS